MSSMSSVLETADMNIGKANIPMLSLSFHFDEFERGILV